jgi:SAM-dependent methyltransferase
MSAEPSDLQKPEDEGLDFEKVGIKQYIVKTFKAVLAGAGIRSGLIAEIGGARNSFRKSFPDYEFEALSLYPDDLGHTVKVADITYCPHIPDCSYDAVFSTSVLEHVAQPWRAGAEIERIMKPGGIAYHVAPFSYFYHKAPEDYWRYSPAGMASIFPNLKVIKAEFFGANRRRDNRGSKFSAVDKDGGPQFALDELGGWRENWHTVFAAQKSYDPTELATRWRDQWLLDLIKAQAEKGVDVESAAMNAARALNEGGIPEFRRLPPVSEEHALFVWNKRPGRIKTSSMRYSRAAALGL